MSNSSLPVGEWFIFRQDAAVAYLNKILREVRWKTSRDPFVERMGLAAKGDLVRILEQDHEMVRSCDCGCRNFYPRCKRREQYRNVVRCCFWFEMDRGRPRMGHQYIFEVSARGTLFWRMDQFDTKFELGAMEDVSSEDVLRTIREGVISEVMEQ